MSKIILVINTGSSSIKFSLFKEENLELEYNGKIENISEEAIFTITDHNNIQLSKQRISTGFDSAFNSLFKWWDSLSKKFNIVAVGHRIVHGGEYFTAPVKLTTEVLSKLKQLIPLAPLHQPYNLKAVEIIANSYPDLLQVGCFDTAFHHTQIKLAKLFAIPQELTNQGIIRYGFHGVSYEYIASVLPKYIGDKSQGKIIVAHLGNGASMCAMHLQKCIATSMGFTALDGLMMGTRCGSIDPGVLLYLLQEKHYTANQLETLLYEQSGLLGMSNISNNVLELENSKSIAAAEAIDLFCFKAAQTLGGLVTILKGCDAIVFTAGIGENSMLVRQGICKWLDWMGVQLDEQANTVNNIIISTVQSKIIVAVIPTNEEYMIAKHIKKLKYNS